MTIPTVTETTTRTAADHDDFFVVTVPQPDPGAPAREVFGDARRAALAE